MMTDTMNLGRNFVCVGTVLMVCSQYRLSESFGFSFMVWVLVAERKTS